MTAVPDLFASSMIDALTELPTILPGEKVCPDCNMVHRGECF